MKIRALPIVCCTAAVLLFSGCRGTEQKEVSEDKDKKIKTETVSINTSQNAASKNSASGNTPAQSQNAKPQSVKSASGAGDGSQTDHPAETAQESADPGQGTAEGVGQASDGGEAAGEDMQQCPYCGQWFSTTPDGDLWDPYDRHVLEERDSRQGTEQTYGYPDEGTATEAEMVQCPDCGNWYEEGNVFRNHICEGRVYPEDEGTADGEMAQCPDCGNWYEEGNVFRSHICEGR